MGITRTSATGSNGSAGFTLVELMVVVAIISITLGVAIRSITDTRPVTLMRQEAKRLDATLQFAAEDALLHGREWGLMPEDNAYRFVLFNPDSRQWEETPSGMLSKHALPETLLLKLVATDNLALPDDRQSVLRPPVLLLSSGGTSAFTLSLRDRNDERLTAELATDGHSAITLDEGHAAP